MTLWNFFSTYSLSEFIFLFEAPKFLLEWNYLDIPLRHLDSSEIVVFNCGSYFGSSSELSNLYFFRISFSVEHSRLSFLIFFLICHSFPALGFLCTLFYFLHVREAISPGEDGSSKMRDGPSWRFAPFDQQHSGAMAHCQHCNGSNCWSLSHS